MAVLLPNPIFAAAQDRQHTTRHRERASVDGTFAGVGLVVFEISQGAFIFAITSSSQFASTLAGIWAGDWRSAE